MGLNGFIKHCARLAATTGFVSGIGGVATMVVGVPADMLNCLTQQFRVTLAVIYAKTGDYEVSFEEFMAIVAISIGVEAGVMITKSVLVRIAERLLVRMSERTAARIVPILGAGDRRDDELLLYKRDRRVSEAGCGRIGRVERFLIFCTFTLWHIIYGYWVCKIPTSTWTSSRRR